jgi:hypothetical protein
VAVISVPCQGRQFRPPDYFEECAIDAVRIVEIKLSQGKPVMAASSQFKKVTPEIAEARSVAGNSLFSGSTTTPHQSNVALGHPARNFPAANPLA